MLNVEGSNPGVGVFFLSSNSYEIVLGIISLCAGKSATSPSAGSDH